MTENSPDFQSQFCNRDDDSKSNNIEKQVETILEKETNEEYFEADFKIETENPLEDNFISDDEEEAVSERFSASGLVFLCPINSCRYSVRNDDRELEREHFKEIHADKNNIDNMHFLRL